jgi:probable F420-dependent oxidoreductase
MSHPITFGLFNMNTGPCSFPETAVRIARVAEESGWDSLWAGEHVVLPEPRTPASPMQPRDRILDPVVALTLLAAHTQRVRLGTGVIILPQRNPLVLAKQLASLDVLSGGRLILGVGAGYLEPEFRALGVPLAERGRRTDEYLAAMQAIWTMEQPVYHGRYVDFAGVQAYPHPVQRPHPPIVVGGQAPGAYRRAVTMAHGWYGWGQDPAAAARAVQDLRAAEVRYGRPAELGRLEINVTPPGPVDRELAARYAAAGVHRLILRPPSHLDEQGLEQFVGITAETLIAG